MHKFRADLSEYFANILRRNNRVIFAKSIKDGESIEILYEHNTLHRYLEIKDTHAVFEHINYYYNDPAFPDNLTAVLKSL